jgi:hypothetical protein
LADADIVSEPDALILHFFAVDAQREAAVEQVPMELAIALLGAHVHPVPSDGMAVYPAAVVDQQGERFFLYRYDFARGHEVERSPLHNVYAGINPI